MKVRVANQRLTGDVKLVMRDAEDLLKATAGVAGDKIDEIRGRLEGALESAKATCERLQEQTNHAAKAADRVIREHPLESLGIAFGLGLFIGALVARR